MTHALEKYGLFERLSLPLALVVVAVGTVLVYRDAAFYAQARQEATQAERVLVITASLMSALKDAEAGQRGFLLTGRDSYLEPYNRALTQTRQDLALLKLTVKRPANRARMPRLEELLTSRLGELEHNIAIRRQKGLQPAVEAISADHGKALMDEIRALALGIEETARAPMVSARLAAEESASNLRVFSLGSLLALSMLLVAAAFTIMRATSRRQQLIRELEESRQTATHARDLLDLTLRSIGDAVISTDHEGRIRFLNPVAERVTGWMGESAHGQPLPHVFRIINERTRDTVENPVEKVLRLGTVVGLANHTLLINRNGEEIPIDDAAAPIRDALGNIVGVVLVFRDITERYRAEKEIEAGRTELARSNEALVRSNTDLERFAYAVSHDLQGPLRTIASFSQLLARSDGNKAATEEYIRFIQTGVNRMRDLIGDLLEYSRVTHDLTASIEPVSFQEVLGEVLWNLQAQIAESNATITADELPVLSADKRSMVQLLQNLIGNSIKYAGPQQPVIHITTEARASGEYVFHVRDNGIGLDMRFAEEIFGVFKRLHTVDQYSGTGIGLAICRRIVDLHGGSIWVEAAPGQGSTFSFSLPLQAVREPLQKNVAV